jgi:putative spermidine/putrescine transport system permease protein
MLIKAIAAMVAVFLLMPLMIIVPMSFSTSTSFEFPPVHYWIGYYRSYFYSVDWMGATFNSLVIAIGTTILTMALTIPATLGYIRYRFFGKALVSGLMLAPLIVPHIVSGLAYYSFLADVRLADTHAGVIIAHTCLALPTTFLVLCAVVYGFDRNLERAAMSAGAGPLRTFFLVTFPVLRPGFLVGALFAFLLSFNEAVVALFITGRSSGTLPKKMFESIRLESDPTVAAVSTLLSGVALAIALAYAVRRWRSTNVA